MTKAEKAVITSAIRYVKQLERWWNNGRWGMGPSNELLDRAVQKLLKERKK